MSSGAGSASGKSSKAVTAYNPPLIAVTGASEGIGKAVCEAFSKKGHPVLMMARSEKKMVDMKLPKSVVAKVDVTNADQVKAAYKEAEKIYGPIDMVFANAGVTMVGDPTKQGLDQWTSVIRVNIDGVLNTIHPLVEKMKARRSGTMFLMSSIAGMGNPADHAVYAATKTFVSAFAENLRRALRGDNVRVMAVCPGVVEGTNIFTTGFTDEESKKLFKEMVKKIGKTLQPSDVAKVIYAAYAAEQRIVQPTIVILPTAQKD
jgi:NADP-dependent 3-hydroxy acid dehydrogenase YdfG